jgi:hypothetical protein
MTLMEQLLPDPYLRSKKPQQREQELPPHLALATQQPGALVLYSA